MKLLASLLFLGILCDPLQRSTAQIVKSCTSNTDVVLVVDASSSVTTAFDNVKNAVMSFIGTVVTTNPNIRIGLVFYNDNIQQLPLTTNRVALENFVNSQGGSPGNTRTDVGINEAVSMLQSRSNVFQASIIVITDAISQSPSQTRTAAQAARALGYTMYAVGVNVDDLYYSELVAITEDVNRIYRLATAFELEQTVDGLGRSICAWTFCTSCSVFYGTRYVNHPTRCDKYYQCETKNNTLNAYEMNCPVNTLWHKRKMTCVRPATALNDATNSGCTYCQGMTNAALATRNYAIGDACEIYYTCRRDSQGLDLSVNCCPAGQNFDLFTQQCVNQATQCSASRYDDSASCRGYFQCNSGQFERGCCPDGQAFNTTTASCEDSSSCSGSCADAANLNCGLHQEHPTNKCRYLTVFLGTTWDQACPGGTSFNRLTCKCAHDEDCPTTPRVCKPDIMVTFEESRENDQGFSESGTQLWVDAVGVVYENLPRGVAKMDGSTYLKIPYYSSNTQGYFNEELFFRVSVKDDFVDERPSTATLPIMTNRGCGLSGVGFEASLWINMVPSTNAARTRGTVTFGVVTDGGQATVDVEYTSNNREEWKELTLRVSSTSIEGRVERYTRDGNGNRVGAVAETGSAPKPVGNILMSDCGIRFGQDLANTYKGFFESILFYTSCIADVPPVDAANPTQIE